MADRQIDNPIAGVDPIVTEAVERFKRAIDWESDFRQLYVQDTKFANGDSDNGWQWPYDLKSERDIARRPALTINKTQQHVLRVVNDGRKNRPAPKVAPVGGQATFESAQIYEGLCRHIGYRSKSAATHMRAMKSQVEGGIGYWRVNTAYIDDESFDQEIVIDPIVDQLGVLLDCDIKHPDGSDAMWGFIYETVNKKEFQREYPDVNLMASDTLIGVGAYDGWITKDDVRVAEYYRITERSDELVWMEDEKGNTATFKLSELPDQWRPFYDREVKDENTTRLKRRKIKTKQLEWFKLAGTEIIGRRKLKGSYIPIVRAVGREQQIDGKLVRSGLVRAIKDAQRMYNYNSSGQAEVVALQTRTPYLTPAAAIEGNEAAWKVANVSNPAYLTWRHMDENNQPIPKPERIQPPTPSEGFVQGLQIAAAEMEMASGQYQPQQVDNPVSAKSPRAINERVQATELSTYDFLENLGMAIAHETRIIIDLAPHVYDTERVIKILGKDNSVSEVKIKPDLDVASAQSDDEAETIKVLFNPSMGRYGVEADVGPAFATARKEAWNAFVNIVGAAPDLVMPVADLMFQSADFPMADELAKRYRKQLEQNMPWLFDDSAVGPMVQQLRQQLDQATKDVSTLMQKLAEERIKRRGKDELRDIDVYDAHTRRLTAAGNLVTDFKQVEGGEQDTKMLVMQTVAEALGFNLQDVVEANKPTLDAQENGGASEEIAQ